MQKMHNFDIYFVMLEVKFRKRFGAFGIDVEKIGP